MNARAATRKFGQANVLGTCSRPKQLKVEAVIGRKAQKKCCP